MLQWRDVAERRHTGIPWWSLAALGAAWAMLAVRWATAGGSAFTYDEATYVDWARHPWRSSYYPESVFVRHPPVYALVLGAWTTLAGEGEAAVRALSALATAAGIGFVWAALQRSGRSVAAWGAMICGASWLVWTFGVHATMYPLAFMLVAGAAWARGADRPILERGLLVALALTHLFGVVWIVAVVLLDWRVRWPGPWRSLPRRAWIERAQALRCAAWAAPVVLWLAAAVVFELVAPDHGGGSGPLQQLGRGLIVLLGERILLQVAVFVVGVVALGLPLVAATLQGWRGGGWPAATAALLVLLLTGPPFLRYFLLLVPAVLVLGLKHTHVRTAVAFAVVGLALGAAYTATAWDPGLENDRLGAVDWQGAAAAIDVLGADRVASPTITSIAHYLDGDVEASDGPGRLIVDDRVLQRVEAWEDWTPWLDQGYVAVVPRNLDIDPALEAAGYVACLRVEGATVWTLERSCP